MKLDKIYNKINLKKIYKFNFLKIFFKSIIRARLRRLFWKLKDKYITFITHEITKQIDVAWEDSWHVF